MVLKYDAPAQEFVWNPEGNPYLIKNGDTLGGISGQVYNNRNKWRSIWDNNKPLIKNPNKIFAGFTIYYLDLDKVATSYAP
jgi:nucleoid-associated protein YgaU